MSHTIPSLAFPTAMYISNRVGENRCTLYFFQLYHFQTGDGTTTFYRSLSNKFHIKSTLKMMRNDENTLQNFTAFSLSHLGVNRKIRRLTILFEVG